MHSVEAYNRKPIPLRAILRLEDRKGIKTLAGLRRAILAEIAANWRQVQEIERREAVVMLKHEAQMDDLDRFWEEYDGRLRSYQHQLLQVLEELAALRGRDDSSALKCKRQLQRERGTYKGLIQQHQARADKPEQTRRSINKDTDERLETLQKLKAPRLERNEELNRMLDAVKVGIVTYGAYHPPASFM